MQKKLRSWVMTGFIWMIIVLFTNQANGQYTNSKFNLVPNPSFENLKSCNLQYFKSSLISWYAPTNNVYPLNCHACTQFFCVSVPFNCWNDTSFQEANSGSGYAALTFYNQLNDQRTYVQTKLIDNLEIGKKYYIEFYVSLANPLKYASNNISLLFSTLPIYQDTITNPMGAIIANAQIYNYGNPIITDTLNWVKVSAVYKALGNENYITIGNFKTNAQTNYKIVNSLNNFEAGYYIDDVSVIPLDSIQLQADAGRDTTITKGDSAFIGTLINGLDTLKWQVLVNGQVIDTLRPGFWVKPTTNTCYVLTQTVNGYTSSDTVCVYVNALPVKFLGLVLLPSPVGEGLGVRFSTANEINVSHYNIQYSPNGKDFKTTGNPIPAKGGSLNEYMVSNSPPLEGLGVVQNKLYYRIQAIDHDGKQTFSEVKSIKLNAAGLVSIYPNPANNEVTVTGKNIQQISISDVAGKTLISTNNKKINISSLPNGTYFISIKTTDTYEVQKLAKW